MRILFLLMLLIADVPLDFFSSYCSKETVDSVYNDCYIKAGHGQFNVNILE